MANESKKSGGLLKTSLIVLGILLVIGLIVGFGWIAGIIWLVFFRKRLDDNPQKQKLTTIVVSALSVLSFIIMVYSYASAPPALKEITISSDMEGKELEAGQDYIINIKYTPEDAKLSNLKYNIDSLGASFSKSEADNNKAILHTYSGGTVIISVSDGEIYSNSLEFNIIDNSPNIDESEAENDEPETQDTESEENNTETVTLDEVKEPLKVLLESLIDESYKSTNAYSCEISTYANDTEHAIISIQLESSDFADQDSCIKVVTDIIEGTFDSEYYGFISSMEFGMVVDSQLYYSIYVHDATAITSKEDIADNMDIQPQKASEANASDVPAANGNTSNSSDASASTGNVSNASASEDLVWIDNTGKKYHSKSTCSNMDAPYQVTRSEAQAMGRDACKKCY